MRHTQDARWAHIKGAGVGQRPGRDKGETVATVALLGHACTLDKGAGLASGLGGKEGVGGTAATVAERGFLYNRQRLRRQQR